MRVDSDIGSATLVLSLAMAIAMLATVATPAAASTWSQENADGANQGRLDRQAPNSFDRASFRPLDDRVIAQITEGPAGLALAGTLAGTVYAIDAGGEIVWKHDVGAEVRNAVLWTGEVVVVLPRGDTAYALTPTGEVAWTLDVDNERGATLVRMASPVELPSGDVILATMDGKVHRVAPNGSVVWTQAIGEDEAIETSPAITSDGDIVAAAFVPGRSDHGLLARLDGASGEVRWERAIGAQVVGAPTVFADRVLVPLRDGEALEARSLSDGSPRWSVGFDDSVTASPSIHEGLAIVGDIRGTVRAVSVSAGNVEWSFHPTDDDPEVNPLSGATYTVADSVAVDADGIAWTSYWVADMTTCCPPTDSEPSPIYRLDAATGELLNRNRLDKAPHGPALHVTGVWAGSDEQGLRSWANPPTVQLFARGLVEQALLVINTQLSGEWEITASGSRLDAGEGKPPATSTHELEPGEHTITLTVDGQSSRQTIQVESDEEAQDEQQPSREDDNEDTRPADEEGEDGGPSAGDGGDVAEDTDEVALAPWLALSGLLIAAGVRRRA